MYINSVEGYVDITLRSTRLYDFLPRIEVIKVLFHCTKIYYKNKITARRVM